MAAVSSSSSPPPYPTCQEHYHVFLSFRGEDTRCNFTSHLHAALCEKNIATFLDDKQIERGEELSSTLLNAIERSRISIIVFSENYASSRWCLDELVKIMECKDTKQLIVIPVFYRIDPTHVRNQTGPYANAFAKHEIHHQFKVPHWIAALKKAANLAGWDSSNVRLESQLIKHIVEDVQGKLNHYIISKVPNGLVGINNHIAKIQPLLCIGSTDVRIIGIWGMGGIGKTTIAETLFNIFSYDFYRCCFVQNVREKWKNNKQDKLRNKLLTEIVGDQLYISTPTISSFVVDRLQHKKVLLVLDDVSTPEQIEYLIGEKSWFEPGSRIIVTTRNKDVFGIDDKLYEVKPLNIEEGLQLFSSKAFHEGQIKNDFIQLSNEVVAYAGGIPLVLKVLGSFLHSKENPKEWKSELQKLKNVPNDKIHSVLSLSYEGLDFDEQKIFLDIACFFKKQPKCHIIDVLDGCGLFTDIGLRNLQDKSLITTFEYNTVEMHDLIQEMGWKIVHRESSNEIEKQSRLWDSEEIYQLFKCKKDIDYSVESISLNMSQIKNVEISPNTFARMSKLRLLKFCVNSLHSSNVHVSEAGLESLPDALCYFCWDFFPLKALPSSFCGEMLVKLELRCSRIEKLWDAEPDLPNLKSLCLAGSEYLIELPNLSKAKNLEAIDLFSCTSLQKVSSSIFSLPRVLEMNLAYCRKLRAIRSDMVSKSLRRLNLNSCSSLVMFSVRSEKLEYLNLGDTAINNLPRSFLAAKNLSFLSLHRANRLEKVSPMFETKWSMTVLVLDYCSNLSKLPDSLGLLTTLTTLSLYKSSIVTLPKSIKLLSKLGTLVVEDCKKLRSLPELPVLLRFLSASGCVSLKTVACSEAAKLIKNSFGSQNEGFLLREIQELKISPNDEINWKVFTFHRCTKLDENAIETIEAEAIMRIMYAVNLLSIDVDPFGAKNFEDTCRRLVFTEVSSFPSLDYIQAVESSALTIKINKNCCENCKEQKDGRARLLYNKLRDKDVRFVFPGSRVPRCFRYRTTETTQITIALPSDSRVLGFAFCLVLSYKIDIYYRVSCECYSRFGSKKTESSSMPMVPKHLSNTVFLWYDGYASNWILEECKSNNCFDFRFFVTLGESNSETKEIKECGVWPIYASDSESKNPIEFVGLRVQPEKRKWKKNKRRALLLWNCRWRALIMRMKMSKRNRINLSSRSRIKGRMSKTLDEQQQQLTPRKKSKRPLDVDELGGATGSEIEKQDELQSLHQTKKPKKRKRNAEK